MHLNTGPQTDAAKAITSQNARTHGLSAKVLVVSPDDQPEFDRLRDTLLTECQPEGSLEDELFRQIVHAQWNLRRCDAAEQEICEQNGFDALSSSDEKVQRQLDRIQRYRNSHHRAWHRALRQLRELQTDRFLQADAGSARPPLVDEMKAVRYDEALSRMAARRAKSERLERDSEFKHSWSLQERALAESVAAADAEMAARESSAAARDSSAAA